jgi:hypothetical protein
MGYATKTEDMGTRYVGLANKEPHDVGHFGLGSRTAEATTRTDHTDDSSPSEQAFTDVAEDVEGPIGQIVVEAPQAGQVFSWLITSGNSSEDLEISNTGVLSRTEGHTLVGPYTLNVRAVEGNPLRRYQDVTVTVTVA